MAAAVALSDGYYNLNNTASTPYHEAVWVQSKDKTFASAQSPERFCCTEMTSGRQAAHFSASSQCVHKLPDLYHVHRKNETSYTCERPDSLPSAPHIHPAFSSSCHWQRVTCVNHSFTHSLPSVVYLLAINPLPCFHIHLLLNDGY